MPKNWRLNKGKVIYTNEQRRKWREYKKRVHSENNELHERRKDVLKNWSKSDKGFNNRIAKLYGIDRVFFDKLLKLQNNKCAVCNTSFDERKLNIDHDHSLKGKESVRGLLCWRCNRFYVAKNDIHNIDNVRRYLHNPPAKLLGNKNGHTN